jgi:hypothetical protein
MARTTTRNVTIDVAFFGDGRIIENPPGTFRGGVPDPQLSPVFGLNILPQVGDATVGGLPAMSNVGSYAGTLQVNLWGTANDYRELARHLLAIAELDTTADPGFHQHYDELRSDDGQTRIHLILRKLPE